MTADEHDDAAESVFRLGGFRALYAYMEQNDLDSVRCPKCLARHVVCFTCTGDARRVSRDEVDIRSRTENVASNISRVFGFDP